MTISIRKLLCVASAVTLGLLATDRAVLAQGLDRETCEDGVIQGTEEEHLEVRSITVNGRSCAVLNVNVSGDVIVNNGGTFLMQDSRVDGFILVENTATAGFAGNKINDLEVRNSGQVFVVLNSAIPFGQIELVDYATAQVIANAAAVLICTGPGQLNASQNETGYEDCR